MTAGGAVAARVAAGVAMAVPAAILVLAAALLALASPFLPARRHRRALRVMAALTRLAEVVCAGGPARFRAGGPARLRRQR